MSREDQAAQKSVTSLTLARSASFHSAAAAARGSPENAARAAALVTPADVRKSRLFIADQYNHSTVRPGHTRQGAAYAPILDDRFRTVLDTWCGIRRRPRHGCRPGS